jgi:hypothetical protein
MCQKEFLYREFSRTFVDATVIMIIYLHTCP